MKVVHYIRPYLPVLVVSLLLASLVGILEAGSTFLIGSVFGALGSQTQPLFVIPFTTFVPGDITYLLGLLIAATIVKAIAEYGAAVATAYLGHGVVRDLRNDVFDRILYQPLGFFHGNPTGELISRVSSDVDRIQTAASETLADFLKQAAILIFLLITIFVIDWKLSTISLILIPLVFFPTVWFGKRLRQLGQTNQREMADMANIIYEAFSGNRIVKAFLMEKAESRRFREVTRRLFQINLRQKMIHSMSSPLMEILGVLVIAAFVLYARAQIGAAQLTSGLFLTFILALIRLYDPVRRMSGFNNAFQQASGASARIFEILDLDGERDTGKFAVERFSGTVEFQNVRFEYDPGAAVLDGVTFEVGKGEVVAIVGSSGAGKTTLVNLAPRFYDVSSGKVVIDGRDVREYKLDSLRRQIAVVTQDVILFDDTVRANIAYGNPAASKEDVFRAAKAALVDDFVESLPEGYETRIGERGLRLSGGERQRISIARALLKNAPILILDEATSSLDTESETLVQRALDNLMRGRTTIVIAHRLSTVRRADRIIVLADGKVQESGAHEELMVRRGQYWKLYNMQFSSTVVG